MLEKTNLEKVKMIVRALLMTEIHETEFSPAVVQHPFTSSGITVLACIASSAIKFYADHYIVGGCYRCAWAVREYPLSTDEQTIIWLILYFNDEGAEII